MFFNNSLENKIQQNELKIKELEIQLENLDKDITELLCHLEVTPEQLSAFVEKPENFSQENWSELLKQRQMLDEKLKCELTNIRNPIKTKKSTASLHVERHWLHVR